MPMLADGLTSEAVKYLSVYPVASVSAFIFYMFAIALLIPSSRRFLTPQFSHPVAPSQTYLLAFDSYRGFAALFVAASHSWYFTYPIFASTQLIISPLNLGSKAVPMFAVLSGFLIYRSVLAIDSIQTLRIYVLRRFFRIYPVYLAGVLLSLLFLQYVSGGELYGARQYFISDIFMMRIFWWPAFANPVTWSLYIEVMFYAILPLVVLTVGRHRMLSLALFAVVVWSLSMTPVRDFVLWRFFFLGIVASELSDRTKSYALPLFLLGVGLIGFDLNQNMFNTDWASLIGIEVPHLTDGGMTFGLGLGCAIVLAATPHMIRTSEYLNVLPLRLLGTISYSVYIIHPFFLIATFPEINNYRVTPNYEFFKAQPMMPAWYLPLFIIPGILTWGAVSFLLFEKPGMRLGKVLTDKIRRASAQST